MYEGISAGGAGGRPERRSHAEAGEASFHKELQLETLSKEYQTVLGQIAGYEADLARGNERATQEQNPAMQKLAIEIGRKLTQELGILTDKKAVLEEKITNAGGNPNDYTAQ